MKMKKVLSLVLLAALMISTFNVGNLNVSASTDDTRYSNKHLQNGGFEENASSYFTDAALYKQPNKSVVPYWDTTAYEGKFEFFKSKSPHFDKTNDGTKKVVAEGEIAAELNADEESTIYQRINTVAGSIYTWGLNHRGRSGTDRMVLIIGPEQKVDPSKSAKDGRDQFVRITHWLKDQYSVEYPPEGCSKKYIVYSKPFAASGQFVNENSDEDKNISLVPTTEINQEWSVWVISSPYCNNDTENGWSSYGTNASDDFDDIMKGASSSLGYDCTYTVPKGQTNTLFAFCSYSSNGGATYGNLLDGIDFKLYQPFSASISPGGQGNASVKVDSNITNGSALYTEVLDGQSCTIYTYALDTESLKDCTFQGAYVTVNNADGTSSSKFVTICSKEEMEGKTQEQLEELAKEYFLPETVIDSNNIEKTQYYYKTSVEFPVSIHLIYAKAPFVLYDANGGGPYFFSPDNKAGGNLVGFADFFQKVFDKVVDGQDTYLDTSAYYSNYVATIDEKGTETIIPGKYRSHAALPNKDWDTNDDPDKTSPHQFRGWSLVDATGKTVVLDGEHIIEYNPNKGDGGLISIKRADPENPESAGSILAEDLVLNASHGITLTALWKFANRAVVQTYDNESGEYKDSALGGTIKETLIPDDIRKDDVIEMTEIVNRAERVNQIDALADAGDKIMFKAVPDSDNNYSFVGWYYKEKQADGSYTEVLQSTSTSLAVTVEEGKLKTYYARFKKTTVPVVFHYSSTGSSDAYAYYEKDSNNVYGKYFQNVSIGNTAVKPTGDSKSVTTWFTSPTERSSEYIFDFSTPITKKTELYASPTFAYNYYNDFVFQEPWQMHTYGTLKFNGKYIDLKNDSAVTDYNVYILKGKLGESTPSPTTIRKNTNTTKIGILDKDAGLLYNAVTNTGNTFNRIGAAYEDSYIFNMNTPVWVMFDFTYKGVTYTSTVKNRSLYNNISMYMDNAKNGFYTTFPLDTQKELQDAQTELLKSIQGMYNAVAPLGITEPSQYADASSVTGLEYNSTIENPYTFTSNTAIRNIEPWGLKYSITVKDQVKEHAFTEFADYGAVILTDKEGYFSQNPLSVEALLTREDAVMYSMSQNNVYSDDNGNTIDIYYVNNLLASDFDKNTYAAFFVKDEQGNYYYSDIISNTYNDLVAGDTSESKAVSESIVNYSSALTYYYSLVEQAKASQK